MNLLQRRRELMMMGWSDLPQGYTQLEYIVNPSDAYIDTGIAMKDVGSISIDLHASNYPFFITGQNGEKDTNNFFIMNALQQWRSRPATSFNIGGSRHNITLKNGEIICDGVHRTFAGGTITNTSSTIICGAWSYSSSILDARRFIGKLYGAEIRDINGDALFIGIPAKNNNTDIKGLYDIVSKAFFTSASTTNFTE